MSGMPRMRPVIVIALVVCLAISMAPWLSGGQEPLGRLISGFALLLGSLLAWRQTHMRFLKSGPLVWSFGLLIALAILSLLWTANRYSSAIWIIQWVMMALAFRLSYAISDEEVGRKWLILAYVISASIFSIIAIWMYVIGQYNRLTGTFYWANPAAAYLIPAMLLGIDGMRRSKRRQQYYWMALLIVTGSAFVLTDSRAATAVLILVGILYLLLVKSNQRFWILLLFSIILVFGTSFGLVKLSTKAQVSHVAKVAPGSRITEAVKGNSTSGSDRIYYLGSAFEMWFSHPILGVGAGAYGDVHPLYQKRVISASTNAHNIYVQILSELGILGAILLGMLLLALLIGSLRGLVLSPTLVPIALGTLALLVHFGLDIDASYPALLCLLGAFFGLMYSQSKRIWVKPSWVWPIGAALLLIPVISLYNSETWAAKASAAQFNGDLETAANEYGRAVSEFIYNPDYLSAEGINKYTLASAGQDSKNNISAALILAHQAETQDPHDGQHFQLEGRILELNNDLVGAERAFQHALQLDRFDHPDYALDLAAVYVAEDKTNEALSIAANMLSQYPPAVVSNRAADSTLAPELANLESLRGNIYLRGGDVNGARISAERALAFDASSLRGRALKHQVDLKLNSK